MNHKKFAKIIVDYLIDNLRNGFSMYYSEIDLITDIDFPYKYFDGPSQFGKHVGKTLGIIGDALKKLELPYLQSLVHYKGKMYCGNGYSNYCRNNKKKLK